MDQVLKGKTLEILAKADAISINISSRSGFDGLASGTALFLSLIKLGKNVSLFAQEPTVNDACKLYGIDRIGKTQGKKDLVVVVDNAVKTVEKVTYFLEGDKLKIVIHSLPGASGISQDQLLLEQTIAKPNITFIIGYSSQEELKREITHEHNIDSNTWLVNITKENMEQKFAQVNINNPEAASLSEIICQLIQDLALPVDEDISYNLYVGITHATRNFSPLYITPATFQTAQWLIKFGAGKASFAQETFTQKIKENQSPINPNMEPFQEKYETPIEKIEPEKKSEEKWLKPPKIYKGSESFDREN